MKGSGMVEDSGSVKLLALSYRAGHSVCALKWMFVQHTPGVLPAPAQM